MNTLLEIYDEIDANNIMVFDYKIGNRKSSITQADDWTAISINSHLLETETEEKSVLMHELGHYHTNAYYNFDCKFELKCRKEYRACRWMVMHYLPFEELMNAIEKGYSETHELANFFNVTEKFIVTAIDIYKRQGKL